MNRLTSRSRSRRYDRFQCSGRSQKSVRDIPLPAGLCLPQQAASLQIFLGREQEATERPGELQGYRQKIQGLWGREFTVV